MRLEIPVGAARVPLLAPSNPDAESGSRLSMWWGLTCAEIALAETVDQRGGLHGCAAVELGCGLGLAGVAAARRAATVTFTDYVDRALSYSRANAESNGIAPDQCRYERVDWSDPPDLGPFDLLLGAEIAYDYFFHDDLVRLVDAWLAPDGHALIADRKRLVVDRALGRLVSLGFVASETRRWIRLEGFPEQEISVWDLRRLRPRSQ